MGEKYSFGPNHPADAVQHLFAGYSSGEQGQTKTEESDCQGYSPFSAWDTEYEEVIQLQGSPGFRRSHGDGPAAEFKCAQIRRSPGGESSDPSTALTERRLEMIDLDLMRQTRSSITKKHHAFRRIWERTDSPGSSPLKPGSGTIDWTKWPPPVPDGGSGVKIPIELYPHAEYDVSACGVVNKLEIGMAARPQQETPPETFQQLKGILNTHESTSVKVTPSTLVFPRSKVGKRYKAVLKLQNVSGSPKRISLIAPRNRAFDVIYGAELNEKTVVSAGLGMRILVNFKPLSDVAVNDLLTILVGGDGAILVPLLTTSIAPPILEIYEFDCGCSTLGRVRVSNFKIRNLGGPGRFWLVTENDFSSGIKKREQKGSIDKTQEDPDATSNDRKSSRRNTTNTDGSTANAKEEEIAMTEGDTDGGSKPPKSGSRKKKKKNKKLQKMEQLSSKPFKLFPAAFSLQSNENIELKARFRPTEPNFHYEKVVLVCDNGEVRWLALRGFGIDVGAQELVSLKGDWTCPPCDLPPDMNATFTLDCGDLLFREPARPKLSLINNSCIPLYFFWSIRPVRTDVATSILRLYSDKCEAQDSNPLLPISIHPAQGILSCREELECNVTVYGTELTGYQNCVISLYVQQVDEDSKQLLTAMIAELDLRNLNSNPVYQEERSAKKDSGDPLLVVPDDPNELNRSLLTASKLLVPTPMDLAKTNSNIEFYLAILKLHAAARQKAKVKKMSRNEIYFENLTLDPAAAPKLTQPASDNEAVHLVPFERNRIKRTAEGSVLKTVAEIDIWIRTVALRCYFDPPFLIVSGSAHAGFQRRFAFHNETTHPLDLKFDGLSIDQYTVSFSPSQFTVSPSEAFHFDIIVRFQKFAQGEASGDLKGSLLFPFHSSAFTLPYKFHCNGAWIEILTPHLDFGISCYRSEKQQTLGIRNGGLQSISWKAKLSSTALQDDQNNSITMTDTNVGMNKVLRFWPEWGALEPEESAGIQVYLNAAIHGKISTTIELTIDGYPENVHIIPVTAEVQSPCLILRHPTLLLQNIFVHIPFECHYVQLYNPTIFFVNFKFGSPIGSHSEFVSLEFSPSFGTVLPRRSAMCRMRIQAHQKMMINNLFVPICVEGMSEPLILQIEAKVKGPQITIIIPKLHLKSSLPPLQTGDSFAGEVEGEGFIDYRSYAPFLYPSPETRGEHEDEEVIAGQLEEETSEEESEETAPGVTKEESASDKGKKASSGSDGVKSEKRKKKQSSKPALTGSPQDEAQGDGVMHLEGKKKTKGKGKVEDVNVAPPAEVGDNAEKEAGDAENSKDESKDEAPVPNPEPATDTKSKKKKGKKDKSAEPYVHVEPEDTKKKKGKKDEVPDAEDGNGKNKKKGKLDDAADPDVSPETGGKNKKKDKKDEAADLEVPKGTEDKKKKKGKKDEAADPEAATEPGGKKKKKGKKDNPTDVPTDTDDGKNKNKEPKDGEGKKKRRKGSDGLKKSESSDRGTIGTSSAAEASADEDEDKEVEDYVEENEGETEIELLSQLEIGGEDVIGGEDYYSNFLSMPILSPIIPPVPTNTANLENRIHFLTKAGELDRQIFFVQNNSPIYSRFRFKAMKFPVNSWIDVSKSHVENLIMRKMSTVSPGEIESRVFDKNGIAFEIVPAKGDLEPYSITQVNIILHSKNWGHYHDEVHCVIEGLDKPCIIKLEAEITGTN